MNNRDAVLLRLILGHFEKALLVGWQWVIGKEFVNMFNAVTSWDLSVLNFISENIRCPFLDTFFSLVYEAWRWRRFLDCGYILSFDYSQTT